MFLKYNKVQQNITVKFSTVKYSHRKVWCNALQEITVIKRVYSKKEDNLNLNSEKEETDLYNLHNLQAHFLVFIICCLLGIKYENLEDLQGL